MQLMKQERIFSSANSIQIEILSTYESQNTVAGELMIVVNKN